MTSVEPDYSSTSSISQFVIKDICLWHRCIGVLSDTNIRHLTCWEYWSASWMKIDCYLETKFEMSLSEDEWGDSTKHYLKFSKKADWVMHLRVSDAKDFKVYFQLGLDVWGNHPWLL